MSDQKNSRNQAEQSVLGGLLQRPELFDSISLTITAEDFFSDAHRHIFAAIEQMLTASQPVDALTVADALERKGLKQATGGMGYLAELRSRAIAAGTRDCIAKDDDALSRHVLDAQRPDRV